MSDKTIMYSSNNEEFNFDDARELIDNYDMIVGQKYWSCEFESIDIARVAAEESMQRLDDYLYEEVGGDYYDPECVYIGAYAMKELQGLMAEFLKKHTGLFLANYMRPVGKSTEHAVTEEDLVP